jgi:hypothetical protein
MPLPKIEKPSQVVLMDGIPATRLVRVVKVHNEDPSIGNRLVELAEKAAGQSKEP